MNQQSDPMSEGKHTPGPYYAGHDTGKDCPNHAGGGLAVIDTGRESDWPIARHVEWNNVPLLTAAPELLEACELALAHGAFGIYESGVRRILQAAIAKARGHR